MGFEVERTAFSSPASLVVKRQLGVQDGPGFDSFGLRGRGQMPLLFRASVSTSVKRGQDCHPPRTAVKME